MLKNSLENLTVHGVAKIFFGIFMERVFWFVLFTSVFIYFLVTLHSLFAQFNSHAFITNSQLFEVDQLNHPSITVCDVDVFWCGSSRYRKGNSRGVCDNYDKMTQSFNTNIQCEKNKTMVQQGCNYKLSKHNPGCYTINPNQDTNQDTPGRNTKLKFDTYSQGVYLFVHNKSEVPSFRDRTKHYIRTTGYYTVILTRTDTSRLPDPYRSNCSTSKPSTLHNIPYSHSFCEQVCTAKYMFDKCKTVGDNWWIYLPPSYKDKVNILSNATGDKKLDYEAITRNCILNVLRNIDNSPCRCTKLCKETNYDAKIEQTRTKKNSILLTIYYSKLEFTSSTEVPSYDRTRFLADIGGIVGLLMGMSMLSLFEVGICVGLFVADIILMLLLKVIQ